MTIAIQVAFALVLVLAALTIAVHLFHGVEPKKPDPPPPAPKRDEERPTVSKQWTPPVAAQEWPGWREDGANTEKASRVLADRGLIPAELQRLRDQQAEESRKSAELRKKLLL